MNSLKRMLLILSCALALLPLCACGADAPEPTPAPTPEATAVPTAAPSPAPTEWVITDESAEEILSLAEFTSLQRIDAARSHEYEALLRLRDALPDCDIRWIYNWQGVDYPSDTEQLYVADMDGLEDALRYLPELKEVDLLEAGAKLEDLDRFSAIRPDIFYLWEFNFYGFPTPIRTDIPVYSSLQPKGFIPHDQDFYYPILKYCKHLKALDLGHNNITDLSLIGELTELQVLILADNPNLVDASPLGNLHELTYLELFLCPKITDWSFMDQLTKLQDINLCYCEGLTNIDFLGNMPDFSFGLFKYTGVPADYYNSWKARLSDAKMVLLDWDEESTGSGWRETQRNNMIRKAFSNWPDVVAYRSYDDLDFEYYGKIYNISYYYN